MPCTVEPSVDTLCPMELDERVRAALDRAWEIHEGRLADADVLPADIAAAVNVILDDGSNPNRQYLLAIAAGTAQVPTSNPASLQQSAGVDRRGQEQIPRRVLTEFRNEKGLTLKISQEAGVSNQWREVEITPAWVQGRRQGATRRWAQAFLDIVVWLASVGGEDRGLRAQALLEFVCVRIVILAASNQLDYPRFRVTPRRAMLLVGELLAVAPDKPDALEAVVAVAARTVARVLADSPEVRRRDINSPDPIDVLLVGSDGVPVSGIEVTDEFITVGKLEHEVVPAMLRLGLDRATVVSRGIAAGEAQEIEDFTSRAFARFEQRIDLVTVEVVEYWLTFPGLERDLATTFLWGIGEELDEFSKDGNRRAWYDVLSAFASLS